MGPAAVVGGVVGARAGRAVHEVAATGLGLRGTQLEAAETLHVGAEQQEDVGVDGGVGRGQATQHGVHSLVEGLEVAVRHDHLRHKVGQAEQDEGHDDDQRHLECLDLGLGQRRRPGAGQVNLLPSTGKKKSLTSA